MNPSPDTPQLKTLLITGATSGIGLELARLYAPDYRLVLVGRKPLAELDDPLFTASNYCRCDLSEPDCAETLKAFLFDQDIRTLEGVIHNAALGHYGAILEQSAQTIDDLLHVNLYAPIRLTHALLPRLKTGAALAFISSVAADVPVADYAVYGATKAALSGFARNLRLELPQLNIFNIYPGPVSTPIHVKSGVPADQVNSKRFPSAQRVAKQIKGALSGEGRELSLGLSNRIIRQVGRRFERFTDTVTRGNATASELELPQKSMAKRILITGAASGIGAALALRYAHEGNHVIALDRDLLPPSLAQHPNIDFLKLDLAAIEAVTKLQEKLAGQPLTVAIHSAGISEVGPFADSDVDAQITVLDVNLRAPLQLTRMLLAQNSFMSEGSLAFVSSLSHFVPYPGAAVYAASKDGLSSYARSLRVALKQHDLNVLSVFPGPTRTPHAARYSPDNSREAQRMSPETLADKIISALKRRQNLLIPSLSLRLFAGVGRWFPAVIEGVMLKQLYEPIKAKKVEAD